MVFRKVVYYSILVGIVAGLVLTAAQRLQVVPIIFTAEVYESTSIDTGSGGADDHAHWSPEAGMRTVLTAFSNVLTAIGYALILLSVMLAVQTWSPGKPNRLTWQRALGWSLAGYAIFWLVPSLGLPPEIPLQNAAELQDRQVWWVICVVCTAAGLGGLAFASTPWRWLAPLVIAVPYLIGAPHPEGPMFIGQTPEFAGALEALAAEFFYATAIVNAVFWLVLGSLVTWSGVRISRSMATADKDSSKPATTTSA